MTNERQVCTQDNIWTPTRTEPRWEHPKARETDTDSDRYIEYKCPICGKIFQTEMPD